MTDYLQWGVDSASRASDSDGCGHTLAQDAQSLGGGNVVFWGRYFGHKAYGYNPMNYDSSSTNKTELTAMRNAGLRRIVPLNSPGITITATGSYSDGNDHGYLTCDGIMQVVNNSGGKLILPASGMVYVYLDVESCNTLSANFWFGWEVALNRYSVGGSYPFFACAYFKPGDCCCQTCWGDCGSHCSVVQNYGPCLGVWSNVCEPGPCSFGSGPGWGQQCYCNNPPPYTLLWQWMENCECNSLDLDYSSPGQDMAQTMLYLP